jgi:septal ring factor EnvC (AmiA/AmiB activator)
MKRIFLVLGLLALTALPVTTGAQSREQASAELDAVRERINALTDELEKDTRRRSRAERELTSVEKSEQTARRELSTTRKQLRKSRSRQADLEKQSRQQRKELDAQRQVLAQQLRVAYISGNEEWLRVVLSQQDATGLGRRMTYYNYLSRQRAQTIDAVSAGIDELEATQEEIRLEMAKLAELENEATEKLAEIADTRGERAELVARINADIDGKDAEIERLQAQASELTELVAALARVIQQMPDMNAEPFAGQTDSLEWPVKGKLLKTFGAPRADGRLKWDGVLIAAPAGSNVGAVYHGRVVFSDWLDGMGLLTIVEHGEGYMSLYGHNQALLKEVGEWVAPGEAIAFVGDSGGQANAGLYFEIRKDGKPVNPANWIR